MRGFSYRKSVQALNLIAEKNNGLVNKMKAVKLVWLADRLHLRKYGRTITGDVYFALPHGPVPSTTRDILELNSFSLSEVELGYSKKYLSITGKYEYRSTDKPDLDVFSETDLESINTIIEFYNKYDQFQLRDISHLFPEWKRWELKFNQSSSRFLMDLKDFFKSSVKDNPVFEDEEEDLQLVEQLYSRNDTTSS